jgi:parallel beta-helix repeat protein
VKILTIVLAVFCVILLAGCLGSGGAATPTPSPAAIESPLPSPIASVAAASPTPFPSPSPLPSPSPIPVISTLGACGAITEPGTYLLDKAVEYKAGDSCFAVTASNVIIDCQGNTISSTNKAIGIYISNADNVTVRDCFVDRFRADVSALNSQNLNISNNTMRGTYRGIQLESVNHSVVGHNEMWSFSSDYALLLNNSDFNKVVANNLSAALVSVYLDFAHNNTIDGNSMYNSINEAAFIYRSAGNRFVNNDMSADLKLQSRRQAVAILESDGTNSFGNNDMCDIKWGMLCQKGAPIDLGNNACYAQFNCNITCGKCAE